MDYPQNLAARDCRWFDFIQECRTSGKSDHQWLMEHNIKSLTFYYHVKQLRKKACDIPASNHSGRNEIQEVVPLFIEEPTDSTYEQISAASPDNAVFVCLTVKGVTVEIGNNATQEVLKNILTAMIGDISGIAKIFYYNRFILTIFLSSSF